jgi:hypothetical protein
MSKIFVLGLMIFAAMLALFNFSLLGGLPLQFMIHNYHEVEATQITACDANTNWSYSYTVAEQYFAKTARGPCKQKLSNNNIGRKFKTYYLTEHPEADMIDNPRSLFVELIVTSLGAAVIGALVTTSAFTKRSPEGRFSLKSGQLSSNLTAFYKFIFPAVWIGGFGAGTIALWLNKMTDTGGSPPPMTVKWLFLANYVIAVPILLWICIRIKRVKATGEALLVSNYLIEERVPFTWITSVTASQFIRPAQITIKLREPCKFGTSITFIPALWPASFGWNCQPVVAELRRLAKI